ncbi:MAG: osmoprotectant transport system permease protein [Actinomycetota bacterium]|jgi:osmoprotectant transport system permease protein|nr:osmoprotectant transport system permease protein [Actinomycetota bacterium]
MTGEPLVRWDWISQHLDLVWQRLIEHIELTVIAVVLGLLIAFPLAVISYRNRQVYAAVTTVTGIVYTIPSLALFAIVGAYTGYLSTTTAEIGLVGYTLLILIRNIVAGLRGVPEDAREAARGMGYSDSQMLWRVELPLALPVIIAGLRLATVTTIGLVTVTAVLGLGGFGHFILDGLRTFFTTETLLGAVLSVVLAVIVDALLLLLQRALTPWNRRTRAV